jgi:hypothetical protein
MTRTVGAAIGVLIFVFFVVMIGGRMSRSAQAQTTTVSQR